MMRADGAEVERVGVEALIHQAQVAGDIDTPVFVKWRVEFVVI